MPQSDFQTMLLVQTGGGVAALPLRAVVETMRPLPRTPVTGAPRFVLGRSVIRCTATLVFDLARLHGGASYRESLHRLVLLGLGDQPAALAVRQVIGVRRLSAAEVNSLPTLADTMDVATLPELGVYYPELLSLFEAARFATAKQWAQLAPSEASR